MPARLDLSKGTHGQQGKGNTLCWEHMQSLINWIKHTIFFPIAWLVFRKLPCLSYRSGLKPGPSKLRHSKCFEKHKPCRYNTFFGRIFILVSFITRCGTSKIYLCLGDNSSSFSRVRLKLRTRVNNSRSLLSAEDRFYQKKTIWRQIVETVKIYKICLAIDY